MIKAVAVNDTVALVITQRHGIMMASYPKLDDMVKEVLLSNGEEFVTRIVNEVIPDVRRAWAQLDGIKEVPSLELASFIDDHAMTCDGCGHVLLDVSTARQEYTTKGDQVGLPAVSHSLASEPEGASACAHCVLVDKKRSDKVAVNAMRTAHATLIKMFGLGIPGTADALREISEAISELEG